jgi:hypothetical protein
MNLSETIFLGVKESQHDNVGSSDLIAEQISPDPEFANFAWIEIAQPRASAGKVEQSFRRLTQFTLDLIGKNRVMGG